MYNQITSIQDFIQIVGSTDDVEVDRTQVSAFGRQSLFTGEFSPLVYIMDYTRLKYHFLTPSIKSVIGYSLSYFEQGGISFTFDIYHPDDLVVYSKNIFVQNFNFLKTVSFSSHKNYIFTNSFRLKNKRGAYNSFLQQYSIIKSSSDGTPLLFLCHITDITHWKDNTDIIHRIERNNLVNGNPVRELILENCYRDRLVTELWSGRETEIVKMICNGYSSSKIANQLHISVHTVNNHRKHILKKSSCLTVGELIRVALEDGLKI